MRETPRVGGRVFTMRNDSSRQRAAGDVRRRTRLSADVGPLGRRTMDTDRYSMSQLAADLKRVCAQFDDEREIFSAIRPLARRAALSKASWLEDRMYHASATQGFGVHLLHEEPDHTLAILAVSWLPHRGTPPHDHGKIGR